MGSIEKYLKTIAKKNAENSLTVNLYAKNGSTYLRRETEVAEIPADVDSSTTAQEKSTTVSQSQKPETASQNNSPMITK